MSAPNLDQISYDGQTARQQLMALAQYMASPTFPTLVVWRGGIHDILAVQGPPNGPIESVMCVAVGVMAREKAFFGTNGTFNPRWADPLKNAKAAKWQGTLECPTSDEHFAPDWPELINNVQIIQGQIAVTVDKRHFLLPGQKLRLRRNIWEAKNDENNNPTRNAITNNYPIARECAQWWDLAKETQQINLLPVYDVNENLNTRPETWESLLVGALVEVTFSLKHYYMGVTATRKEAYDVFSANIESISVLVKPPPFVQNPYRARVSPKKPRPVGQTPLLSAPSPGIVAQTRPSTSGALEGSQPADQEGNAGASTSAQDSVPVCSTGATSAGSSSTNIAPVVVAEGREPGSSAGMSGAADGVEQSEATMPGGGGPNGNAAAPASTETEGNVQNSAEHAEDTVQTRGMRSAAGKGKKCEVDAQDSAGANTVQKRSKKDGE